MLYVNVGIDPGYWLQRTYTHVLCKRWHRSGLLTFFHVPIDFKGPIPMSYVNLGIDLGY